MLVVSEPLGREQVHDDAPPAEDLDAQMPPFLSRFNAEQSLDPVLKATLAHFWLMTIHPFADGYGRIARASTAAARRHRFRPSVRRFTPTCWRPEVVWG
jgi:Fic family protein